MKFRLRTAVAIAAVTPALAVPATSAATTLIGSGSSAEQPIVNALINGYKHVKPSVHITYNPDGGNAGVKDVQDKHSQFAINTRAPLPSDSGTLQTKLYLDGLCVDVNKANKLKNLSVKRTANIFLALTTSWSSFGSSKLSGTIDPIGRNSAAGSYTFFQQAVLDGKTQASNVEQLASDGLVASAIKSDRHAIGYVGLAHSGKKSGIKSLKLNGKACNDANIRTEKYPMSRFIWGVLPLHGTSKAASRFLDWVKTSQKAGTIINKAGAVSAFNKKKKKK